MPGYISEISYGGLPTTDFIEFAVPTGLDLSGFYIHIYDGAGALIGKSTLGSLQSTIGGQDVYLVDSTTSSRFGGISEDNAVAVIDNLGNVVQFVSFGNKVATKEGGAAGETSTDIGTTTGGDSLQSDDGGATYYDQSKPNPGTIPCYARGTLIDTPDGPRAVEALKTGDLVETLDHGPLPVRWVRRGDQALGAADAEGKPVLIRAGAFGPGSPARDLVVSPQHRVLVGGAGQLDGLFDGQCFAPAKSLTGLPGIRFMNGKKRITWVHFALDSHEVVLADGCLSESLLLGPMVLNGLTGLQRRALTETFGETGPDGALNGPAARDCLRVGAVRRVLSEARERAKTLRAA